MCWATSGRNSTWNDPQTNTIFLCCSCIVFALRQPRTVTSNEKRASKRGVQNGVALEHWISLATHSQQRALLLIPRSIASRFWASARFAAALRCCSACQPLAVDLQRRHQASAAKAFPQKTPDCNIPVFCPNVARHLQLLDKETFVERRFSCLGRNTNWQWLVCAKHEAKASPRHHNATRSTATLHAWFTGGSRAPCFSSKVRID